MSTLAGLAIFDMYGIQFCSAQYFIHTLARGETGIRGDNELYYCSVSCVKYVIRVPIGPAVECLHEQMGNSAGNVRLVELRFSYLDNAPR